MLLLVVSLSLFGLQNSIIGIKIISLLISINVAQFFMYTRNLLFTVAGEDFNAASVEVVIPESTMENGSVCVNISLMVIDDHIVESPETFTIELTGSTPPVEIGYPSSATVTIIDNDSEFKERICIVLSATSS